ncbi:chloride channel protein [Sphingomonas morindae]|uniref:Chloride channel protein n=1 Tax=Sphingomonas morindae TaxID=1541170 RepID=A0ABY4X3D6_9SPHN|nr:chloride channel protein [Sphingomonas morindae]USI71408.1 chloride channel protein [Sphingomonas morindae]
MSKKLIPPVRVLARHHGPILRRRVATLTGAIALGLAALLFAALADQANRLFLLGYRAAWWAPLLATPLGFAAIVAATRRLAPDARGSGIPQIMAARANPLAALRSLTAARTAIVKFVATVAALLVGASVGREGPTVQISATIMAYAHRLLKVPITASVMVAGGAAGVAAAFNTPLAGVTFAIEELAAAYEQKMTLLVMTAVLISGMVSLGLAGDYVYFGAVTDTLPLRQALVLVPVAGVLGGLIGGGFSRAMLGFGRTPLLAAARRRPVLLALVAGLIVAVLGCATGLTWGTSYEPARLIILGADAPWWFGPAKLAATLATAVSGLPGGIFAPSLATGAGLADLLRPLFPGLPAGPVVLLGMVAYFTGVVRAPLTAVVILSEATASRGLLLPLLASALVADAAAGLVCRERLYHGLARGFLPPSEPAPLAG